MTTKACIECEEVKPLGEFHRTTRTKSGRVGRCKSCRNRTKRQVRATASLERSVEQRAVKRRYDLQRNFGITPEEYDSLLEAQGGVCAVCNRPEQARHGVGGSGDVKRLAVDHDHGAGAIRGLLCNRCNRALGLFNDDSRLLLAAAQYLGVAP